MYCRPVCLKDYPVKPTTSSLLPQSSWEGRACEQRIMFQVSGNNFKWSLQPREEVYKFQKYFLPLKQNVRYHIFYIFIKNICFI